MLPVEGREDVGPHRVEVRALGRSDANGIRGEEVTHRAFAEDAGDLVHHLLETGELAQRVERRAIGGMLPRRGGDVGQDGAGHRGLRGEGLLVLR
ncbi:hypothetical protein D3C83_19410 [compost metagenome]